MPHEDGAEKVSYDDKAKFLGVRAALQQRRDEDGHIRDEYNTEQPAIEREDLMTQIAEMAALSLLW